ncbi:nucleoside recognition domain-containing protein [Paenibacillus sp. D2_2]|uniref:nucleoside recognition domain-containing protein n=1 Tax=Paenibacillus sp. D2_2 TaxID=3073092 RepID=UPI0035C081FE
MSFRTHTLDYDPSGGVIHEQKLDNSDYSSISTYFHRNDADLSYGFLGGGGTRISHLVDVLFPSLFPFFVISELMLGFGIVHFIGKLLDPLMQPLFRIPGTGGFVAAMSFASGYPVSAKLTTKLRRQLLIGREEGERLVAFTTTSDPIFLIGAVSVGFFGNPKLACALALVHYGSAIIVGFIMRFYGTKRSTDGSTNPTTKKSTEARFSIRLALRAMHEARLVDGRSLGELLRHSVTSSLQLMVVVGGLVVFFSVILEVLTAANVMSFFYNIVQGMLTLLHLPLS